MIRVFSSIAFLISLPNVMLAQTYAPDSVSVRAECKKVNTDGCTDHINDNVNCKAAPPGWLIHVDSVSAGSTGAYGIQIICRPEYSNLTTRESMLGPVQTATRICLRAHIESGGGGRKIGTTFYNNCRATYNIVNGSVFN